MRELDQEFAGQGGRQRWLAASDALQQPKELVGGKVLEEVPLGAALDRLEQVRVFFRSGQDDHFDVGLLGADEPSRGQAIELGHVQVHEHDVRTEPSRLVDRFASVAGFAGDVDAARLEHAAQSVAEQRVVVGDQNAHGRLVGPAEDERVEAARQFDQARPGGRVERRCRGPRSVAGDDPAFLHQHLGGAQSTLPILIQDQRQRALVQADGPRSVAGW